MYDPDIEERLRSGGQLTTAGIVVLVLALFGTCVASASNAGGPNAAAHGFAMGQSPWLLIPVALGIALITFGQVRKTNARHDAEARYLEQHTRVDVVLDEESPDGPFRGDMKEVEVLDPAVASMQEAERERERRRGGTYLAIGGGIIALTIIGLLGFGLGGGGSAARKVERVLVAFGLSFIPFGFGLFFAIKGALLRSK